MRIESTILKAKTNLSRLVRFVENGDEVILMRGVNPKTPPVPVARIVPYTEKEAK